VEVNSVKLLGVDVLLGRCEF